MHTLPDDISLVRMTFTSTDGGSFTTPTFSLNPSIYNVVYIDWTAISGIEDTCFLQISEVAEGTSVSSKGFPYWRFLLGGTINNSTVMQLKPKFTLPRSYNRLSFSLVNAAGQPLTSQTTPWSIELLFYTKK